MRQVLRGPQATWVVAVYAAGLVLPVLACNQQPTAEDQRRLDALATRFAGRYELRFEAPVYVRAKSLSQAGPSVDELREIFEAFWLDPNGVPRQDSNYVYLNAYDERGEWKLQLSWDPTDKRIVESRDREHY